MKKLSAALLVLISFSAFSQTLFYYGNDSVSAKDFLNAYTKNNSGVKTEKAFSAYLDLYIASRLKIEEAKKRRYDTLPQLLSDLETLRQQLFPAYLVDKETLNKLVTEAYTRSQKDIHIAHIFISANNTSGAAESNAKAQKAFDKLKNGNLFSEIARQYSDDPSAKLNGGDLGWITVFSLPYELENLAYSTPMGKLSGIYKSKGGYHIFKNLGVRKAVGRMKAAEIVLALPPEATNETKAQIKKTADSLYYLLSKGDDFGKLATQFSNDIISSEANGQMQDFGIGEYDPVFTSTVFALTADGAISKPFITTHGYHIVKRISSIPVISKTDEKAMQALREKVAGSDRMNTVKSALAQKILKEPDFKKATFSNAELWTYTDSVINYKTPEIKVHLTPTTPLFTIKNKTSAIADWINFVQTFRYKTDGSGIKTYAALWNEFTEARALDYYQAHLEDYNEAFRRQMNEFKEGNLFFEIMQRQVWNVAQTDTAAVLKYYENNRGKYIWKKSADAILFYASDTSAATTLVHELKKAAFNWHQLVSNMGEKIAADSLRLEATQIPNGTKEPLRAGTITAPLVNKADNTASFAYILKMYEKAGPRSFVEARGLVITDYQNELEKNWLAELKKKYPVVVNKKVWQVLKIKMNNTINKQ